MPRLHRAKQWSKEHLRFRPWTVHSPTLFMGGLIHILIGYSYLFLEHAGPRFRALTTALHVAPIEFWVSVFIVAGILTMLSSVWPRSSERWGYIVLAGIDSGWAAVYISSIFVADVVVRESLAIGLSWGLFAFVWRSISRLSDPAQIMEAVLDDGAG